MKPAKGEQLTIALTKGRILSETLPLLAEAGVSPLESVEESRKLIFPDHDGGGFPCYFAWL